MGLARVDNGRDKMLEWRRLWGMTRCRRRSTTCPPNGPSAPGSTGQVPGHVRRLDRRPRGLLGRARQADRLDQAVHPGQERLASRRATSRSDGSRTASSTSRYNCVDRHLAERGDQIAIIWEGDDPAESKPHHLPRAARRGLPLRQRAARRAASRRATASPSTCR